MAYASWSVVYGEQPSAAKWNILGTNDAHFYSFLGDNLPWQTWTPTFANFTKGSATVTAKYTQVGKTVHFRLEVTLSSSTMGSIPTFTLPITASSYLTGTPIGQVEITDTGTTTYTGVCNLVTTTTAKMVYLDSNTAKQNITSTQPMTWANTDVFAITGTYEAA
jgi:hypothetical protein